MFAVLWFFVDSQKMLLFSRQVGVCLLNENSGAQQWMIGVLRYSEREHKKNSKQYSLLGTQLILLLTHPLSTFHFLAQYSCNG